MEALVSALAALLAGIGAYFSGRARREASQANKAVNNAQNGQPRIYDMIFELHAQGRELIDWKRTYDGGPLDSGQKVTAFVERVDGELETIRRDVHEIRTNCSQCQDEPPPAA
jgi:hypothetical protein